MASVPIFNIEQAPWFAPVCYALSVALLATFGIIGVTIAFREKKSQSSATNFVTAAKSVGLAAISSSFYAACVGAWTVFVPAQFAGYIPGGWTAAIFYGVGQGLTPFVIAISGITVQNRVPNCISFSDFCRRRYGFTTWCIITLVVIFNMLMFLLTELTSTGSLFLFYVDPQRQYLKLPDVFIIIMVAGTVAIYTAAGGLKVSLITDILQGGVSLVLLFILFIWVCARYRYPLLKDNFDNLKLGAGNYAGGSSVVSLSLSVIASGFFNEAQWQRVWAAKTHKILFIGSIIGGGLSFILIFFFGALGVLSAWSGLPPIDPQGNLTLFTIFENNTSSWIACIMVLLTVVLNECQVDSLQNGLLASFTSMGITIMGTIRESKERKLQKKQGNGLKGKKQENTNMDYDTSKSSKIKAGVSEQNDTSNNGIDNNTNGSEVTRGPEEVHGGHSLTNAEEEKKLQDQVANHEKKKLFGISIPIELYNTLPVRLGVIVITIIVCAIATRELSLLNPYFIANLVMTIFWTPVMPGIWISPVYYSEWMQLTNLGLTFISMHVFTIAKLKHSSNPIPYSTANVFAWTWLQTYNNFDYSLFLVVFIVGLVICFLFVLGTLVYRLAKGHVKRGNIVKDIFFYHIYD